MGGGKDMGAPPGGFWGAGGGVGWHPWVLGVATAPPRGEPVGKGGGHRGGVWGGLREGGGCAVVTPDLGRGVRGRGAGC